MSYFLVLCYQLICTLWLSSFQYYHYWDSNNRNVPKQETLTTLGTQDEDKNTTQHNTTQKNALPTYKMLLLV
jgi:hypothetical protein